MSDTNPLTCALRPDGVLYNLGWYLSWTPGDPSAVLDGNFTAEELQAIAEHMKTHALTSPANV